MENKFETRTPCQQNAVDIFRGKWASNLGEVLPGVVSGKFPMFKHDPRPQLAAKWLGRSPGSFAGMTILELGPLEAAHTYQLIALGAEKVVAVESNTEAYMKCLIVKEALNLDKCSFLLGDCLGFLEADDTKFDMIFCSGILYHMSDPYRLIKAISQRTDRVFLWTHYYDPASPCKAVFIPNPVIRDEVPYIYNEMQYADPSYDAFWGGIAPISSWLTKSDIKNIFERFGYSLSVHEDDAANPNGSNLSATAIRA